MTRGDSPGHLRSVGLGLYIVREIVVAHGGEVDYTSSSAEGTTFVIDLPRSA
ncbi:MAG: sensor histidine kinase [Pseudomonadota bacterium]|nr:sensor histidine kinase [Pseudomonadota bacterium]